PSRSTRAHPVASAGRALRRNDRCATPRLVRADEGTYAPVMELDAVPPTTLRALLAGLRPGTVTLHAGDADVPVAEPVICDPNDLTVVRPGDLVLAVGSQGWGRDTLALLRRAETAGACGVV